MQTIIQILGTTSDFFKDYSSFLEENKQVKLFNPPVGSSVSIESQYRTSFLRLSLLPLLVFGWLENYLNSRIKHRFYILLEKD